MNSDGTCVEISDKAKIELPPQQLITRVHQTDITAATLRKRLEQHVERANYATTFESVTAAGPLRHERSDVYLKPFLTQSVGVVRLMCGGGWDMVVMPSAMRNSYGIN